MTTAVALDERKLEACAQVLFRKRKAWLDMMKLNLGEDPLHIGWNDLTDYERGEYIEEARVVLLSWGVS